MFTARNLAIRKKIWPIEYLNTIIRTIETCLLCSGKISPRPVKFVTSVRNSYIALSYEGGPTRVWTASLGILDGRDVSSVSETQSETQCFCVSGKQLVFLENSKCTLLIAYKYLFVHYL